MQKFILYRKRDLRCAATFFILHFSFFILSSQPLLTPFEKNNKTTATYYECIAFYKNLEKSSKLVKVIEAGASDVSHPIHAVIISNKKEFSPEQVKKSGKVVLFINNGIHPGEPDGIDASMLFAKELVADPNINNMLNDLTIVIIPIYNVGGSLNRNNFTRVNQNGPEEYGFRGNAQNLDLNRDFIKCDSKNAETFTKLFQSWDPDVFVDTHCSDGADYPYSMTLITSQRQKLEKHLGDFVHDEFLPAFYDKMKADGLEACPYVNSDGDPVNGIYDFMDLPRLSSGYAALFHAIPFVSESHMLKPYNVRVNAQRILLRSLATLCIEYKKQILKTRQIAKESYLKATEVALNWKIQNQTKDSLLFKGYVAEKSISEVTGKERIKYNPHKAYEKKIPYFNFAKAEIEIRKPDAYIIPAVYQKVIDRLTWNGVKMHALKSDTVIQADFYRILDYKSPAKPYENHYLHSQIQVEQVKMKRTYFKGDYIIYTNQPAARYIIETLEPQAPDSYFAWNFFDAILQRKEYFSDYLFEDLAPDILKNNPELKESFEKKKRDDPEFAKDPDAMLFYIYSKSQYSEPGYMIYPVGRI
jgi:hypothetical protein